MTDVVIDRVRDGDLAGILRDFERFWGDRELPRALHHPIFFCEFADTALYQGSGRPCVVMRRPLQAVTVAGKP